STLDLTLKPFQNTYGEHPSYSKANGGSLISWVQWQRSTWCATEKH
ncbi:hypothetical protein Tco_0055377, partial [Tanacetum coccineum]